MKLLQALTLIVIAQAAYAQPYQYNIRKDSSHTIHIITLNSKDYETKFIKAHNQVFGRETISHIAEREGADVAINGGFFEIGGSQDGMPSSSMVAEGKIFGLSPSKQDQLMKLGDKIFMKSCKLDIEATWNQTVLHIDKYNKFPENNDVVLYTDEFGNSTLTNYKDRAEAAFDKDYHMIKLYDHGNIQIPRGGFVLSFTKEYIKTNGLSTGAPELHDAESLLKNGDQLSAITGIPILLQDSFINPDVTKGTTAFYTRPHARTALGLKQNGDIILVFAEHFYKKDLNDVTIADVKSIINDNKLKLSVKYKKLPNNLTLDELKEVIKDAYTKTDAAVGLTIPELANLMLELGCDSAINLDGGSSSAMWIEGEVVGHTIGDKGEGFGKAIERAVSDAIIFRKR